MSGVSEPQQPPIYQPAPVAPPVVSPPPREAIRRPIRIEPVPETPYGLAIYGAPPTVSGPSIGSLVAGIASILVSLVVSCFAAVEMTASTEDGGQGTGALVGGAFAVLAGCLGIAGVGLGVAGMRQTRRARRSASGRVGTMGGGTAVVTGRGMAVAGLICGAVGLAIAACSIGVAVVIALG
jgi:hypothetical protein